MRMQRTWQRARVFSRLPVWAYAIIPVLALVTLITIGLMLNINRLPSNVVVEPESGQWIMKDVLIILASGQDVETLVAKFGGKITHAVPETDTYQARFPVSNLDELKEIQRELGERGVQAVYAIVRRPPRPFGPQ